MSMAEYRLPNLQKNTQTQPSQLGTAGNPAPAAARLAANASSKAYATALPDSGAGQAPPPLTAEDLQDLTTKDLVKSLILSEVLGKPRSMRKARW